MIRKLGALGAIVVFVSVLDSGGCARVRAADSAEEWLRQAAASAAQGASRRAVEAASRAIEIQPGRADAYYLRGREHFRLGEVQESVADFEKVVELNPRRAASLWELGISYYYAAKFEQGARQFELYQTYHDSDVENGVWRYLCMARSVGVVKARKELLPIGEDPRVPMTEIYAMYRDQATPEDVLQAARQGAPPPEALRARLFYAHLYIGLFHEAAGRGQEAKAHLEQAAGEFRITHYMGDVARVHLARLKP